MRRHLHAFTALALLAGTAAAQRFGPWHVLGRFDFAPATQTIADPTPFEKSWKSMQAGAEGPDLAATYKGMAGETIRWVDLGPDYSANALGVGKIDLNSVCKPPPAKSGDLANAVCYLYRRIDAPADSALDAIAGSDDGLRLWLNGELVAESNAARGLCRRDHRFALRLKAGANHLLAKVSQHGGGFAFEIATPERRVTQEGIDRAIDRGVDFLISSQLVDGSWGYHEGFGGGHPAFTAYTLLKCGVRPDHPAVRMAMRLTETRPMDTTYATSSLILALEALGDAASRERLDVAVRDLLEMQDTGGLYSYPLWPGDPNPRPVDLSNSLFAALALRAAHHAGVRVPDAVWRDLASGALRCWRGERQVTLPSGRDATVAGFSYRIGEEATGSMTTAGLSVLALAEQYGGKALPAPVRVRMQQARDWGLDWIAHNLTWTTNPGAGGGHVYFWIYGLERVGVLLGADDFDGADWYWDGAEYLVERQGGDGSWNQGYVDEELIDTHLALLFLKRATRRSSGESSKSGVYETREPRAHVRLRATGDSPLTVWVTGVSTGAVADGSEAAARDLRVERVDYFARYESSQDEPALVASVAAGGARANELQRFALRHQFDRRGVWKLSARVVLAPEQGASAAAVARELDSPELAVRVDGVLDPVKLGYADDTTRDLLFGARAKFAASSTASNAAPERTIDGSFATRWSCKPEDEGPWLRLTIERPIKADALLLSHANPRLRHAAEPTAERVAVTINGKERFEVVMADDRLEKARLAFGSLLSVREIELRILSARRREVGKHSVGFAEVELQRAR
jgi:hypothetical protein